MKTTFTDKIVACTIGVIVIISTSYAIVAHIPV